MSGNIDVIGYSLDKAMKIIGTEKQVIIDSTITPFKDKQEERKNNIPIIVRQINEENIIKLTVSYFK